MNTSTHTLNAGKNRMRVLVIGGGFAGGMAAVRLAGRSRGRADITVVNPRPTLVHRLRMHQVAAGQTIAAPDLRTILGPRVSLLQGYATGLDPQAGQVTVATDDGERRVGFDRVVLATGSVTEPAPGPGGDHVHAVGDLGSARRLRAAFASLHPGAQVAVVGGGFTGLETVTELAAARPDVRVRLITSGEVGGWFTPAGAEHVRNRLRRLGVETVGEARARAVEPGRVLLDDGAEVPADLTVWCGGFTAPPLARQAGLAVDEHGAALTDAALQSVSHPHVMAVGDAGHAPGPRDQRHSMCCPFAFSSGAHAADLLGQEALGRRSGEPAPFDMGYLGRCVALGPGDAVLQLTTREDVATGTPWTGRATAGYKEFVLKGIGRTVWTARYAPGLVRWPRGARTSRSDAAARTVAA
ncbi:NAD(P)/FAD-dependent oxidoreductase [Georgenia deserti]|uniref:NAD(P)/FAD-dependent oxidoreductase n=1 Tax=Georgenia deserti TaxID=2093781 RepID=A0ABW4L2D9_9MICO